MSRKAVVVLALALMTAIHSHGQQRHQHDKAIVSGSQVAAMPRTSVLPPVRQNAWRTPQTMDGKLCLSAGTSA
jgi:hypothetical protein